MVMLAVDSEIARMAVRQDLGWFLARGKRPHAPSRRAPPSLVDLIHKHGARLTEVARELGVNQRTVQRWWCGSSSPRPSHLRQLLEALSAVRARQSL